MNRARLGSARKVQRRLIRYAVVVQQAASKIGLKVAINRVPSDGYWSNHWIKDAVHFGNINARPTPDILFSLLYKSDAAWNETGYKSETFDSMLLEARGLLDDAKRKQQDREDVHRQNAMGQCPLARPGANLAPLHWSLNL